MSDLADICDDKLIALAGEAAFARGLRYFDQSRVIDWHKSGNRITARVQGSELYQVTLTHNRQRLEGGCDCPASEGIDFCKHCVAATLAYRQDSEQQARLSAGPVDERIEAYLNTLDKQTLSRHLLQYVLAERELKQEWSIKADIALNLMDTGAIKKRITAAIPYKRHLYRFHQVRSYFARVEPVVELLQGQLGELEPREALRLVDYALQRLCRAYETIDDSGGFRLNVEGQLQEMHYRLLERLSWGGAELADYLLDILAGPNCDMYQPIPYAYAELLGEEGMDRVFASLQREWDALPPLTVGAGREEKYPYFSLQHLLRQRAMELNQPERVVELLRKTATEARDYLDMCDLCMEMDDWPAAERLLERAREIGMPDYHRRHRDYRMERLQIRLLLHRGDASAALDMQWGIYRQTLTADDYEQLLTLADQHGERECYRENARAWLLEKLDRGEQGRFSTTFSDALITIYLRDGELNAALDISDRYPVYPALLKQLASACSAQPEAAIPLYGRLAAREVEAGNNAAYRRAVGLLMESAALAQGPVSRRIFETMQRDLRVRFKAKRNFIKYLNETFRA